MWVWLAAEENFVKTTSEVEAEKARLEIQLESTMEEYEDKLAALTEQVDAWSGQVRSARQQVEAASLATRDAKQELQLVRSRLEVLRPSKKRN